MKTLAFDTSTKFLSIACLDDNKVLYEFHEDVGIRHSEILVAEIKKLLDTTGWNIKKVELISVGIGPGSFTGLRIAIATVKGFAVATGNKVVGVPTMDAIALNYQGKASRIAPFLDARKGKVYTCIYEVSEEGTKRITDDLLVTVDEFLDFLKEKTVFFGDAVTVYKEKLDKHPMAQYEEQVNWYPKAPDIARLGIQKAKEATDNPADLTPLYLHAKECNVTTRCHSRESGNP